MNEAVQLALKASQVAKAATAKLDGAGARVRGAKAFAAPIFTIAQPFGKNTGGLDEDLLITGTLELGDKRRQRIKSARAEFEALQFDRKQGNSDVAFATQSAYIENLRAEAERKLAEETLKSAQEFVRVAELQFQAGDVARTNVIRSKIELNRAEQTLKAAETDRDSRTAALKSLAGLTQSTELDLSGILDYAPLNADFPLIRQTALNTRNDLKTARKLRDSKEAALHGARVQSIPDLILEARHSTIDPTVGGNSIRLGIQFPLFDTGRNRASVAEAEAAVREQTALLNEASRAAQLDIDAALRNFEQAKTAVASFQNGRLKMSKELLDLAQIGYAKGANSYLELLDARTVYRTEQTDYTRALSAYQLAIVALQRSAGGTLPK